MVTDDPALCTHPAYPGALSICKLVSCSSRLFIVSVQFKMQYNRCYHVQQSMNLIIKLKSTAFILQGGNKTFSKPYLFECRMGAEWIYCRMGLMGVCRQLTTTMDITLFLFGPCPSKNVEWFVLFKNKIVCVVFALCFEHCKAPWGKLLFMILGFIRHYKKQTQFN